jgi:hypothetical protein
MVDQTLTVYKENQRLDDLYLYILFAVLCVLDLVVYRIYLIQDLSIFTMSVVSFLFFAIIFFIIRLQVTYSQEGIRIRFFPFYPKGKWIPFHEIESATWITVNPLKDFGGYGYRNKPQHEVFVLRGRKALQIKLKNAKKAVIIGVLFPEKAGEIFQLAGYPTKNNLS